MTIKQQINHGDIKKVCHLHNDIFHSIHLVTLCQFYPITSPVLLKVSKYGMRKMKTFGKFGSFNISLYIKGGRKLHIIALDTIAFLDSNVCVNNPY